MITFQKTNILYTVLIAVIMGIFLVGCSGFNLSNLNPPSKATPLEENLEPALVTPPSEMLPSPRAELPEMEATEGSEKEQVYPASEQAQVESIEIMVSGSIPVELQVAARGVLAGECVSLGEAKTKRAGNTYKVTLFVQRQEGETCDESPVTFEKKIPLDVKGLSAGLYTVDVNGVLGTFEFAMDNIAPQDMVEQPPIGGVVDKNTISGMVWHDLCAVVANQNQFSDNQAGAGCIQKSAGKQTANGILELGEPGLEGVLVNIRQGDCSSNAQILQTVVTDANGKFIFRNVTPAAYCVQVDAANSANRTKLSAGEWTYPNFEGMAKVQLAQDEQKGDINFGWDFQSETTTPLPQDQFNFVPAITPYPTAYSTPYANPIQPINTPLPIPIWGTPQQSYPAIPIPIPTLPSNYNPQGGAGVISCLNRGALISESIMPNGPTFQPGMNIVKTWRVKNIGTCVWQTGYTLVFVGGDQMNAINPTITGEVQPNNTVDISVQVTAPSQAGVYTSNWMLRSINGEIFGLSDLVNQPLIIQVSVSGASIYPTPEFRSGQAEELKNLGVPTWYDSFWNDTNWYMLNDENTVWQVRNGALYMTARKKIDIDRWGLSKLPSITDFYYEIEGSSGAKCGGFDSYGVIVRAQDFDSGYVFGITCNGTYRLYQWDHGFFKNIQPYKASAHIRMGTYKTNRLGVMAVGNKLRLYVNGYFLEEYETDWYKWGQFGLMLGPNKTENLTIMITEAAYWQFR